MGRRAKELTADQKAQVEALAAYLSQDQIADYLGIGRTTFQSMIERDPEISERYKRGKAKAVGLVAQGLLQKARAGDTTSAIFYLKTQAGWRETQKIEHTGADGAPIQVETLDVSKLSTETLAEIMAARDAAKTS